MSNQVLFIGTVWPEPKSSAGGSRTMQLIEFFRKHNWPVTFACASSDSEFAVDLAALGLGKVKIELNSPSFDSFVKGLSPDIVVFDKFMTEEQFGWRVAESCPDAIRILDTIDLHCLRQARHSALKRGQKFKTDDLVSDIAMREIASILRSDLSLFVSRFETCLLHEYFRVEEELLHYTPFMLDPVSENEFKPYADRKGFVTIGNFLHEPNWDSVKYLKEEIWPLIRKQMPDAEMNVYGAYVSQKVEQLHRPSDGFFIRGRAENAMQVISDAKVLLAPLRFGAGIKGKLAEAMQSGTPSVTTSIGAEAMHDNYPWNGMVVDDAKGFSDAAVKLYSDEAYWKQSQQNGITIINEFYSKEFHSGKLLERIRYVQKNRKEHRHRNFYGAMLMHHTLASTKYMSKWIEEKNK